jgi:hypothetical protein
MTKNCAEENRLSAPHGHLANPYNRRALPRIPRDDPDCLSVKKCQG